jgi:hypothetical protein
MNKTNDTPKLGHGTLEDHGTLADSEFAAVTGGMLILSEAPNVTGGWIGGAEAAGFFVDGWPTKWTGPTP